MDDLAAGGADGRLLAWDVAGEFLIDVARAGDALGDDVAERAAADHLGHLLGRGGAGQALGHDGGGQRGWLAEQIGQQAERALEAELHHLVRGGGDFLDLGPDRDREDVALGPALQAGNHVARQDGGVVVKAQPVAQGDLPGKAVIFDDMAGGHLRLRLAGIVDAIQCVVDEIAVVAGDQGGGEMRIDQGEVGLWGEFYHLGRLGLYRWRCEHGRRCGQETTTLHFALLPDVVGMLRRRGSKGQRDSPVGLGGRKWGLGPPAPASGPYLTGENAVGARMRFSISTSTSASATAAM